MDETQKHYTESRKSDRKDYEFYHVIDMKFQEKAKL